MKFIKTKTLITFFVFFLLSGCQSIPKEALILSPTTLQERDQQSRYFDTQDEETILSASAGVLQDLGFTLDESETRLGFIVASKERDATNAGQVAVARLPTVRDLPTSRAEDRGRPHSDARDDVQ